MLLPPKINFTAALVVEFLLLSTKSAALPSLATNLGIHERRQASITKWIKRDRIALRTILPVRIGLTQNCLDKGYDFLMDM